LSTGTHIGTTHQQLFKILGVSDWQSAFVVLEKFKLHGIAPKDLRGFADDGKQKIGSGIVVGIGVGEDGKAGLVVGVTADLVKRYSAVELVKVGTEVLGGKGGGGRPDLAQAGGPDGSKADAALAAIEQRIRELAAA